MKTSSTQEINFVPKGWGFEKWIHNSELYCGKLLYFVKDKKCATNVHNYRNVLQTSKIFLSVLLVLQQSHKFGYRTRAIITHS